jgi:outer membrane protein assembly factor BamB
MGLRKLNQLIGARWNQVPRAKGSLMLVLAALALMLSACDWTEFGYSVSGGRSSPDTGISLTNVGSTGVSWTATTGASVSSSPAVANGIVYVGSDGVHALNATTGATVWTAITGVNVSSSPAVANGIVYVGSRDNNVYALNATTGATIWTATTSDWVDSSPAVANGIVYVGSFDGKVYALNATTGARVWTASANAPVFSSPAVANGIVYVGSEDHNVYALNATTGATVWTAPTGDNVVSSPAVANGIVYVGSVDRNVYALNAKTGARVWTTQTGADVQSSPAVANGIVYVGSYDGKVYALSATTGATVWTTSTGNVLSSPAVANGIVYVGSWDDKVYALNATTGATVWTATTGSIVLSSPAVANGIVYVGSWDDKVYAYKPWAFTRPACAVNPHSGLNPCQIQDAYRLPSSHARSAATVAIVDAYNDPNAEADLGVYRSTYGLPACTTANGCFKKLNQSGVQGSYPPPALPPTAGHGSWDLEISLDLDAVSATCPLCHIVLVESNDPSDANLAAAEDTAANQPGVVSISNSYVDAETSTYNADYAHAGIIITASTGDIGYAGGPQFPATDPGVVAVGGTQLVQDTSARGWAETTWSGAGSGCSNIETEPSWQSAIPVSWCSKRSVADVSALAGAPGLSTYDTYNSWGGWTDVEGTSLASPIVASVYALAAPTKPVSYLYSHAASLNDITAGSNGSSCGGTGACNAQTGYDGPTGLGTPCGTAAFGTGPWQTTSCPAGSNSAPAAPAAPALSTVGASGCGPPHPGWVQCGLVVTRGPAYASTSSNHSR